MQRDLRVCRACVEAGFLLESLPVLNAYTGQRAYLYGQAPGPVEGAERRPWRGRAGQTLRRWLGMDEEEFYATFYCASVTRCYPGKHPAKGDRVPTPREQDLCQFWRDWELELLRPRLIVPIGGLAIKRLLGRSGSLAECVGVRFEVDGTTAIPLPHPSGVSTWLNAQANRALVERAAELIRSELAAALRA